MAKRRKQPRRLVVTLSGDTVRKLERLQMLLPLDDYAEPGPAEVVSFALDRCLDGVAVGFPEATGDAAQNEMLRKLAQLRGEIAGYRLGDQQAVALAAQIAYLEERYALSEML